ncbi:MAG TPA: AAA family ATPase, partial [Mizugakiibacter sp.]|nr:AAA family ATPase [Mizugakiibacter sp.]
MSKVAVNTPDNPYTQLVQAIAQVNSILLGKAHQVRLAYTCLLAGGHLLLEDLPVVGKTTLAHTLA